MSETNAEQQTIHGAPVVPGVAFAEVVWTKPRPALPVAGTVVPEEQREQEVGRFQAAVEAVAANLEKRAERAVGDAKEVLSATVKLTRDKGLFKQVRKQIRGGHPADYSTVVAAAFFITQFENAGGVMAERVTDMRDIRDRIIAELHGEDAPGLPNIETEAVVFAPDLAPADTAGLDTSKVKALVTELGGPTSHTAIIARQLSLPCIVAVGPVMNEVAAGTKVLVNGTTGDIVLNADPDEARELLDAEAEINAKIANWSGEGQTKDGRRVQLLANVQDGATSRVAAAGAAEGIGLFRTELCFLSATEEPSVDEQARIYAKVFAAFPPEAKIVVRSLDAGSDKPVPFASMAHEENPALGVRGLRVARANEPLLTRQLDAIALAAKQAGRPETWVMAPMVATVYEAGWFAKLCRERDLIPGAMIEVPATVMMADKIMQELEFVSIGTNDLTQYTMAADRLSPQLAYLTDPWQPAVLRLIQLTCQAGWTTNTAVGVCGEAAADPDLAVVLTGLGVNSLSAAASALPRVGALLAEQDLLTCQRAAKVALMADGASEARAAVRELLEAAKAGTLPDEEVEGEGDDAHNL